MLRRFASTSAYRLPPTIRQLLSSSPPTPNVDISTIQVNGWVKSIRRQKKVSFAVISDGSSAQGLQAVFSDSALAKRLTNGACVRLSGKLADSLGAGQEKELQVEEVEVLGECDPETYPIQKQALSPEYLRDNAHLRARTDPIGAMLRLRDSTMRMLHGYFRDQGFTYAHTPILTSNDCEGAGEAFRLALVPPHPDAIDGTAHTPSGNTESKLQAQHSQEFFSRPSFLTVSSQLHLEALSSAVSRVYTLSPCFRAEHSQTSRHLAEFWMLEAEWAFGEGGVGGVCGIVEGALRDVLRGHIGRGGNGDIEVLWKGGNEVKRRVLEDAANPDKIWPRMSYGEAIKALESHHHRFQFKPEWGRSLQSEHEKWLAEVHVGGPVFVTDYPAKLKPFYMRMNDDGLTVACFDLLVPGVGELVGGSVREERGAVLEEALGRMWAGKAASSTMEGGGEGNGERGNERGWKDEYGWYADLRRYGGAPHAGFGMGFERLVAWIGGIENIRECVPMPRWAGRMLL